MAQPKKLVLSGTLALIGFLVFALLATGCVGSQGGQTTTPAGTPVQTADATTVAPAQTVSAQSQATAVPAQTTAAPAAAAAQSSATTKKVTLSGSTSVLPIAQGVADQFMAENPSYDIRISGGGSGAGVQAIGKKTVDIGMSSRELSSAELSAYPTLQKWYICDDGIAVIVPVSNPVDSITLTTLQGVYAGKFNNWNQLGGPDLPIVIIGRDSTSGTREYFYEKVMEKKVPFVSTIIEKNSNGAVAQTVSQTPGAIGYISLGFEDPTVKALKIKDVATGTEYVPTVQSVQDRTYPLWRPLYMFTNGAPNAATKTFLDYIASPAGQAVVLKSGGVPLKEN